MKLLKKFLLTFWILSYLFLLFYFFDYTRYKMISFFWNILGFPYAVDKNLEYKYLIPVQVYNPIAMLNPVEIHIPSAPKFPIIDFHGHIFNIDQDTLAKKMQETNTKYLVDLALRTTTLKEYEELENKFSKLKQKIFFFPGLNWNRLKENNNSYGIREMARDLEEIAKNKNIKGIKIWKDFGLMRKKENGDFWKLDDPEFDPIWQVCKKYKLIVAMHIADPPAFFEPINEKNERLIELTRHPEWSFSKNYPSFKELLQQRENIFKKYKDIIFVALHFGELSHDLKQASYILDNYPNVYFDIAQRIDELGRQPRSARDFIIKYQDRILYGIDGPPDYKKSQIYWRFLETYDEYFDFAPEDKPKKGLWKIYGIGLPDTVLEKLYYKNATKLLNIE